MISEATARALLDRAVAADSKPAMTEQDMLLLMDIAAVVTADGTTYNGASLNRAASIGWNWKAGKTADRYNIGGGSGKPLNQSEWYQHCLERATAYGTGTAQVFDVIPGTGGAIQPGGAFITSLQVTTQDDDGGNANDIGAINV